MNRTETSSQALDAHPAMNAMTSEEDLARVLDGIYRKHHRAVFRLALRYGAGNEAWAEDIVQDVFVKLIDHLAHLEDPDDLGGWLYRVTTRRCFRKLERDRFLDLPLVRTCLRFLGDAATPAPEAQWFARQDLERTRQALERLPPKQRLVVCMVHLDGRTQQEIGEILGMSKSYVCKLLGRGLHRLHEELDA